MTQHKFISSLRQKRVAMGLRQAQLAARLGVSRQSLSAIESGNQVPSTALALELAGLLQCTVEDLFCLDASSPLVVQLAMPAAAGTRVTIARVAESWIAHPTSPRDLAADGVLLSAGSRGDAVLAEQLTPLRELENHLLIAGCAPLLSLCTQRLERMHTGVRATWIPAGSKRALELMQDGFVHVAGIHPAHQAHPTAHLACANRLYNHESCLLVHLTRWRQGIVTARGNPLGIATADDLRREELRLAIREPGAAARDLLEHVRRPEGRVNVQKDIAAQNHQEVADLIRYGQADAGVAIEAVAVAHHLDFVPLTDERFDLICAPQARSHPVWEDLLTLLSSGKFRREASSLPGYDCMEMGLSLGSSAPERTEYVG